VAGQGCGNCGRRRRGGRAPPTLAAALAGAGPSALAAGACLHRGQMLAGLEPVGGRRMCRLAVDGVCRRRRLLVRPWAAPGLMLYGRQRQGLAPRRPPPSSVVVVPPWWWGQGAARCLFWRYGGAWVAQGLLVAVVWRRWEVGSNHVHERATGMVQSGESLHRCWWHDGSALGDVDPPAGGIFARYYALVVWDSRVKTSSIWTRGDDVLAS
jgi:hypothetical protein